MYKDVIRSGVKKRGIIFLILLAGFSLSLFLSLFYGLEAPFESLIAVLKSVFGATNNAYGYNTDTGVILALIRIPAVIKAIVAGSCLALAGMFLQTISKNPLADPYLTGLSSGAGLGIVISILLFSGVNYSIFGFLGALLSAVVVITLSGFSKFSITKLILIGLSLNLFTSSIISFLILLNPDKAYSMTLILTGGFSSADVSNRVLLLLFIGLLFICGLFIPKLNILRLDTRLVFQNEHTANKYSIIFVILAAFLTSLAVYSAGILGFAGIICPLLVRLLLGGDTRVLFFGNILAGSSLILFSNFISNNLIYPVQIPLGITVAIIGAPFFVFFLLKKGGALLK